MAMTGSLRPLLLFWYGQLLSVFKRNAHALQVFREVARGNPGHQQAWSCIGFLLAEREQFEDAAAAFERALALVPHDAPSHFNIAYVLQRLGRHEEALARFERTIEVDPKTDRAWYGLGLSLAKLGRLEEAAEKLQEAARLQPMNPYAAYQLASVWHRLGRADKLRTEYERVEGFDPKVAERIRLEFGLVKK